MGQELTCGQSLDMSAYSQKLTSRSTAPTAVLTSGHATPQSRFPLTTSSHLNLVLMRRNAYRQ